MANPEDTFPVKRRSFLQQSAVSLASIGPGVGVAAESPPPESNPRKRIPVHLSINGVTHRLELEPRVTLLDALREWAQLTGTKMGCNHGQCGACTVLVDGRQVLSCLTLAHMVEGREITTIEGIAGLSGEELHPMQEAFIEHDAFQCGFCTPGQIVSAVGCVAEGCTGDDEEIRESMSGNLCRCAAYPNIVTAIKDAAAKMG